MIMLCRARVCAPRCVPSALLVSAGLTYHGPRMAHSPLQTSWRMCATTTTKAPPAQEAASDKSKSATDSATAQQQQQPASAGAQLHVDRSRLPRTIPGMSPEELAVRIEKYQAQLMTQQMEISTQQLEAETEMMRRSLSPEGFQEYLRQTEKMHAKVAKEAAKVAAMTPEQAYRYQQKQRRKAVRYEWYKTFMLVFVFAATIFFLFFIFMFFT